MFNGTDLNLIYILIRRGANVNHQTRSGFTPLMAASEEGVNDVVRLLLIKGANPGIRDMNGDTALIHAAQMNKPNVVMTLLRAGADQTIQNKKGRSFLTYIKRFPEAEAFRAAYLEESKQKLLGNPKISGDIAGEIAKFLFKGKKKSGKRKKSAGKKKSGSKKTKKSIRRARK